MKNKNKYIGIWGILIFSLLLGCSQFEEINTNPDTSTQVSPSMLCTEISLRMFKSGGDAMSYISGNALPKYVGYAIMAQNDAQYNKIGSSDFGAMTILPNIDKMLEYAQGNVMEDSYKGVASFAKAYTFYNLTMSMGDVPYTEANMGLEGIYRPKYDTQEEIFKGILDELKAADQYFAKGIAFTGDPTPYNGDPVKWRKATNAFALKVLMTLSKKADVASLGVKTRFSEIVTAGNLMEPTTGFLGLNYSTQNKHPLNSTNDMFTTKTVISSLLMNNLKNLNDYRLFYYSEPAGAEILGGKLPSDTAAYVGVDVSMDYSTMNADYNANKYSLLNKRYVTEDACEPRMILTYAEQQLIIAEARVIGWITTGTAQTYYQEGVKSALAAVMATKASYAHGKAIDQTYIDSYFTGEAAFKSTTGDQLKQIWMQRYILNFMQIAESSFYEYRRTGYPEFPINPATSLNENNKNGIPMRWLYPSSETNYNRENLIEALDRQYDGYDEVNKLMWLLK
ncbi:MAG: SusD/RagB family nutrient-binding outer membrane lipoprotein [Prolixibacteraceae bacterium]|jgi:hypothetical protein